MTFTLSIVKRFVHFEGLALRMDPPHPFCHAIIYNKNLQMDFMKEQKWTKQDWYW